MKKTAKVAENTEAKIVDEKVNPDGSKEVDVKLESPEPTAEPVVEKLGDIPANFCMEPEDWTSTDPNSGYDATSNNCTKSCKKDFPDTFNACVARSAFLSKASKVGKTAKAKKEKTAKEPREKIAGAPTQTSIINSMLKEKKTMEEMVAALTPTYNGSAKGRILNHLVSIRKNLCVSAKLFAPGELDYLNAKPVVATTEGAAAVTE